VSSTVTATRPCVVCAARERRDALTLDDGWRVLVCPSCGLRTLDPEPAPGGLVEVFDDGTIYDGALSLRDDILARHRLTLASLERRVRPGRLLDVGCGLGFFLEAARGRGWEGTGIDPSPFSVEHVRSMGFEAHRGLLHQVDLEPASFDAIALLQVIEHVLDPRELLAGCMRLLRPGGALLVATPNPRSLLAAAQRERFNYWIPPVHCVWYPPATLKRTLETSGYQRVRTSTWSARARGQHDGVAAIEATRLAKVLPVRTWRRFGDAATRIADAAKRGSIVEAIAIAPSSRGSR
jgi:SAM-dependent methyltransferase